MAFDARTRRHFLRDAGILGAAASAGVPLGGVAAVATAEAAETPTSAGFTCPNPNPIVHENRCTDPGTFSAAFQVANVNSVVTGYARQPSVNIGEDAELVISGPNLYQPSAGQTPLESASVELYRLGYYDGIGGRLIWSSGTPVSTYQKVDAQGHESNSGSVPADRPSDSQTGVSGRADYRTIITVPGTVLTTSGVYLAKVKGNWQDYPSGQPSVSRTGESHIVLVVRDDARPRDVLVLLPTNTWQAYNYWGGRSLYTYNSRYGQSGNTVPATGTERAAKVSLDRPYNNWVGDYNWVLRTEFPAIWWLERHGYDVAYTEDVALAFDQSQALPAHSRCVMPVGHGEYWSQGLRDALDAGRDAGTSIFNLGANTGYWRVRHETAGGQPATTLAEARVLVCYKTVEGGGTAQPTVSALADPVSPTTTWRDPGKGNGVSPPGTTAATPATYAGPNRPESSLLGVQYIGDDDAKNRGLTVPADNGGGEFAGHRAWRHTSVPTGGATVGTDLVGWEWDGIPAVGSPFGVLPTTAGGAGALLRVAETDPRVNPPSGTQNEYIQDAGRRYSAVGTAAQPPAGGTGVAHAVTYTAPSGAHVFSAGTIQWSWGLGPHYLHLNTDTYATAPVDHSDARIAQATTNLLADAGILPLTPDGLTFDPVPTPTPTPDPTAEPTPSPTDGPGTTPTPGPTGTPGPADTPTAGNTANPTPTAQPGSTPTPGSGAAVPALRFALEAATVSRTGRLRGRVFAAAHVPRTVTGTVQLTMNRKVIGTGRFTVNVMHSKVLTVKLTRAARLALAREGQLKPLARVSVIEHGKTTRTDLVRVVLKAAKSR